MMLLIFVMPGNETIAERLASVLGAERGITTVRRFPDGESYVRVESAAEGRRVAIVYALDRPDDKLVPLLLPAAAAWENGATDVDLVAPYLAYMRQDSCFQPGKTVSAQHPATWLPHGFDWSATIGPHLYCVTKLSQVYVIPTRHVHAAPVVATWLRTHVTCPALVGPNEESNQWVAGVANRTDTPMVVLHKVRKGDRDVKVSMSDTERWRDHTPMLVDDIVSTGCTMAKITGHLRRAGLAASVCITIHTVFSGNAVQDLELIGTGLVVSCDTIVHPTNGISVAPDLASAVHELMQDPGGAT